MIRIVLRAGQLASNRLPASDLFSATLVPFYMLQDHGTNAVLALSEFGQYNPARDMAPRIL